MIEKVRTEFIFSVTGDYILIIVTWKTESRLNSFCTTLLGIDWGGLFFRIWQLVTPFV